MVVVPLFTGVTSPVVGLTLATEVFELAHTPPLCPFVVNCEVVFGQMFVFPLMVPGFLGSITLIVTLLLFAQPKAVTV
jgi:hypothetical protein